MHLRSEAAGCASPPLVTGGSTLMQQPETERQALSGSAAPTCNSLSFCRQKSQQPKGLGDACRVAWGPAPGCARPAARSNAAPCLKWTTIESLAAEVAGMSILGVRARAWSQAGQSSRSSVGPSARACEARRAAQCASARQQHCTVGARPAGAAKGDSAWRLMSSAQRCVSCTHRKAALSVI